jgi:hypothetical protein
MVWWEWAFCLLLLAAVVAAIVVPIVWGRKGGSSSGGYCPPCQPTWAQGSQSGTLFVTASATGPGATGTASTAFVDLMSATITTCKGSNAIVANVSAQSSIATVDQESNPTEVPVEQVSVEVAQITVQILVDGVALSPSIVFDGLAHILDSTVDPFNIRSELAAQASANSFNWVASNVAPGTHTVTVQAQLSAVAAVDPALFALATAQISNGILILQPATF